MLRRLLLMLVVVCGLMAISAPAWADTWGVATWYDLTGNYTASGDVLGYWDQTCASPLDYYGYPIYPMGSRLDFYIPGYGYGSCTVTDTGDMSYYGVALDLNIGTALSMGLPLSQGVYTIDIYNVTPNPYWYYGMQVY